MTTETTTNVDVLQPSKLFFNKNINRKLELDMQQEIMDSMVQKGQAERMPGLHGTAGGTGQRGEICLIYWKSPAEWAELLYTWVGRSSTQKKPGLTIDRHNRTALWAPL